MDEISELERMKKEAEFYVKVSLKRIEAAYNNVERTSSEVESNAMKVVFVSDEFFDKFEEEVGKLPFTSEYGKIGRKILMSRKYKDFMFVAKDDFPEAQVWDLFKDFFVLAIEAEYIITGRPFNWLHGAGGRGYDCINFVALDSETYKKHMELSGFICTANRHHSCWDIVKREKTLQRGEWLNSDVCTMEEEKIGEVTSCNICGAQFFVDVFEYGKLINMYKEIVGLKESLSANL